MLAALARTVRHGSQPLPGAELADTARRAVELAAAAGPAERERMERAFVASCHYEIRFWEMAWSLEDWTPPNGS